MAFEYNEFVKVMIMNKDLTIYKIVKKINLKECTSYFQKWFHYKQNKAMPRINILEINSDSLIENLLYQGYHSFISSKKARKVNSLYLNNDGVMAIFTIPKSTTFWINTKSKEIISETIIFKKYL